MFCLFPLFLGRVHLSLGNGDDALCHSLEILPLRGFLRVTHEFTLLLSLAFGNRVTGKLPAEEVEKCTDPERDQDYRQQPSNTGTGGRFIRGAICDHPYPKAEHRQENNQFRAGQIKEGGDHV